MVTGDLRLFICHKMTAIFDGYQLHIRYLAEQSAHTRKRNQLILRSRGQQNGKIRCLGIGMCIKIGANHCVSMKKAQSRLVEGIEQAFTRMIGEGWMKPIALQDSDRLAPGSLPDKTQL